MNEAENEEGINLSYSEGFTDCPSSRGIRKRGKGEERSKT